MGFDYVGPVEHHFTDYAACPDPFGMLSYVAARTSKIDLITGAVILPWNNPLRVVEQALQLDILSEGRLINLGNATGHPSRIMDGSFANQVIAQMYLYERKFAALSPDFKKSSITVEVLPKHLDEQVAALMVGGFGGVLTKLTPAQAKYINVNVEGPFKADSYKY